MHQRRITALFGLVTACLCAMVPASMAASGNEGVQAASEAFYSALAALDDGSAMAEVWAHAPYVTFVGPRSKAIVVGWEAIQKYWEGANKLFAERNVALTDAHVHANGDLAWEVGLEVGEGKLKNGTSREVDQFVTNVYERQADGRWLIVSHHVQPKPQ